ncbi:MAG: EAL domain-containing protein [Oligoflexales bacterium]
MICFLVQDKALRQQLRKLFKEQIKSDTACFLDPTRISSLSKLYEKNHSLRALVTTTEVSFLPNDGWVDMLAALNKKIPVILLSNGEPYTKLKSTLASFAAFLRSPTAEDILQELRRCGITTRKDNNFTQDEIPELNLNIPAKMLEGSHSLSVLAIDTSRFREMATKYGSNVYKEFQAGFQKILFDLWGTQGNFRSKDMLFRHSSNLNLYFVILEQPRSTLLPSPRSLETLSDRLHRRLYNALIGDMMKPTATRVTPSCVSSVFDFSVGYSTLLFNPCIDSVEAVNTLFEESREMASSQQKRFHSRKKEYMQSLILASDFLIPHYQAVFDIRDINIKDIDPKSAITDLGSKIFGFESLIRVNPNYVNIDSYHENDTFEVQPKFLKPDILFNLATSTDLSIDLDQKCLRQATEYFSELPGKLFVNILPRNFYFLDKLQLALPDHVKLVFEVSESEAIDNFDLLVKIRDHIRELGYQIAIDDFGKGYSGLERIIHIQPDIIKLDRHLITNIHSNTTKQSLVRGIVEAASLSQSTVLAEGVETIQELEVIKKMGIPYIQGFLMHRPSSYESIQEELQLEKSKLHESA